MQKNKIKKPHTLAGRKIHQQHCLLGFLLIPIKNKQKTIELTIKQVKENIGVPKLNGSFEK